MDLTRPCFVALTARGGILARRLADFFGGEWHATRRALRIAGPVSRISGLMM